MSIKNICQLVKEYNIEELLHRKLWFNDNFEFSTVESKLVIAFNDELKINKNYIEMNKL